MSISSGTKILFETIKNGSREDILQILKEDKEIDLNGIDEHGKTVLTVPFENEQLTEKDIIDVLKYFLDRGVDPEIENEAGETALFQAAASLNKGAVDLLIRRKSNNKICKTDNNSVTQYLVKRWMYKYAPAFLKNSDDELKIMEEESASYVEWLITRGFDFEDKEGFGMNALSLCLSFGLQHIALAILQHKPQINVQYRGKNNLLHHFFNLDGFLWSKYHCFEAEKWHNFNSRYASKILKILIDREVSALDVGNDDQTALWMALKRREELNMIDMLLDQLVWSNRHQRSDVATMVLIELFKACEWWGDESRTSYFLKVTRMLIAEGANVNLKDMKQNTALYYAFEAQNLRAAGVLDENGADFAQLYDGGKNLFHVLAASGQSSDKEKQEALFELLADKICCDMNARDHCARTPLHYAAQTTNMPIACKLIQHGVNVNAKDSDGRISLHLAVGSRDDRQEGKLVELLLTSGSEVNRKDRDGKRPLAYVNDATCRASISLLLKWGALVNDYQDEDPICSRVFGSKGLECVQEMLAYGLDINDSRICEFFESPHVYYSPPLVEFFSRHWIKHKVAELPCPIYYEYFSNIMQCEADRQYYQSCLQEVAKLKSSFIDSRTSLYDYLHLAMHSRVIHNNSEKLRNFVDQSDSLEQQFSQYYILILANYRTAIRWKSLLEPAKEAWLKLTNITLPDICVERIFAYLSIEDLVVFFEDV